MLTSKIRGNTSGKSCHVAPPFSMSIIPIGSEAWDSHVSYHCDEILPQKLLMEERVYSSLLFVAHHGREVKEELEATSYIKSTISKPMNAWARASAQLASSALCSPARPAQGAPSLPQLRWVFRVAKMQKCLPLKPHDRKGGRREPTPQRVPIATHVSWHVSLHTLHTQ